MTPLLEQGGQPADCVLDETGLKVRSVSFDAKRDYKWKADGKTRQTVYGRGENPRLEGSLEGEPIRDVSGALAGLAIAHPGTAVALLNLPNGTTISGFVFTSTTKVILLDQTVTRSDEVEDKIKVPFIFYPAIATYSSATS